MPMTATPLSATLDFQNIDDPHGFQLCEEILGRPSTKSFVACFNADHAHCATGLDEKAVLALLDDSNESPKQTQWLSFWGWDGEQRDAINVIAKKYNLSSRLTHLLCPRAEHEKTDVPYPTRSSQDRRGSITSISDVADDLWHFCSVDWGQHFLYVGYNALFTVPGLAEQPGSNKPTGQRMWTSLLLCDDGTVVSVFEAPRLHPSMSTEAVGKVRRNQLNVFRHLSKITLSAPPKNPLMQVNIRPFDHLDQPRGTANIADTDSASLLFYYLFDDWTTTYDLIARREHPYYDKLEEIRQRMFETAEVDTIRSLHQVGRQLVVLKLMYQSYQSIISHILHRQRYSRALARRPSTLLSADSNWLEDSGQSSIHDRGSPEALGAGYGTQMTVRLPMLAMVRFERLLERIKLYAITEIEECLGEKESLVFMNFNLVSLKESQAIEKMSRTTVLLAKATILFLPVSLMTAYFSMQISEVVENYSLKTYWLCFMVVVVVSISLLFGFGLASGTVEGRTVYKSLTRVLWEKSWAKKQKVGSSTTQIA